MIDFHQFFHNTPDAYLVLGAGPRFEVLDVNSAYQHLTRTIRPDLIGKPFSEILGSLPSEAFDTRAVLEALSTAVETRQNQQLTIKAKCRSTASPGGENDAGYWRVCHIPLVSAAGQVQAIVHRIEETTELVEAMESQKQNETLRQHTDEIDRELRTRIDELERTHRELAENERKLQETEVRLEVAARVGEIGTWIWEVQKDRIYADNNVARWYHVPEQVARGGALGAYLLVVHPDDLPGLHEHTAHALAEGSTYDVQYRIRSEGSDWRWVAVRGRIERDAQGQAVKLVGVVIDITQLRRTTEALAEIQERLQLAIEAAAIGSFSWSLPPGDIVSNQISREHFWLSSDDELTLDRLNSIVHPEDRDTLSRAVERCIAEHETFDIEFRTVSAKGQLRWVRAKGRAYYDSAGHATRFEGITIDNTPLKQIEANLRGVEARYRLLVESLDDYAVIMEDDAGYITSWNPGAERLLLYREPEVVGRSARIFFTPEDQAQGVPEKEISEAKEKGRSTDDRWHMRKDGSRFFVSGMMVAITDDQDRRVGLVKIMRDITDRELATAERERLLESERAARAEAERNSRMKDEFLATLSHELRTPLNAILGWTQVLKEGPHDPTELEQGLEVIDRNTRLQAQLIEDLLDMSRIVSGKVRLNIERIDLTKLVRSAIAALHNAAETKGIRLEHIGSMDTAELMGDRLRLHQVILNLLSNALKFTPAAGTVEASIEVVGTDLQLTIRDTGVGIRPEFLPHVFERFRQADASTTRQFGGLGLGLAIVKQLVELHGGEVQAESEGEGKGSTFRVLLPTNPMEPMSNTNEAPRWGAEAHQRHIDLSGLKVLVVDDEPDSASLVKRVLEGCHAHVHATASMDEALAAFASFQPDVLLSDIGMPHHDGYELIRRIRLLPEGAKIPAAALTALARSEDVQRAIEAGFQTHVAKPVEPAELVTVTAHLAGRMGSS